MRDIIKNSIIQLNIAATGGAENVFYYLCSNKNINNIYDYVATKGFKYLVDYLRKAYDFILLDTPPKYPMLPEISTITSISDGVIILASRNTNRTELLSIVEKFEHNNDKVLGIITRTDDSDLRRYMYTETSNLEKSVTQTVNNVRK